MNGLSQKLNVHYFIILYMTDFCMVPYKVYLFCGHQKSKMATTTFGEKKKNSIAAFFW